MRLATPTARCAAGAAFACDDSNYRYFQTSQLEQIHRDSFSLIVFFSCHARVSSRRIDEGHNRQSEFFLRVFTACRAFLRRLSARARLCR